MRSTLPGAAAVLAGVLWIAAASMPAPARAEPGAVGLVRWPSGDAGAWTDQIEQCLTGALASGAPGVPVVPSRRIRDRLFPLLESSTEPGSDAGLAALLHRSDVADRLQRLGLRFVVAYTGATTEAPSRGGILCGGGFGAGGCLGLAWQDEHTALSATLWDLRERHAAAGGAGAETERIEARAEGRSVMPAFILPIPLPARTRDEACGELGRRIAASIRTRSAAPVDAPPADAPPADAPPADAPPAGRTPQPATQKGTPQK